MSARGDAQAPDLRQVRDEAFGDAIAQVVAVRVAAAVDERQHRHRTDRLASRRPQAEELHSRGKQRDDGDGAASDQRPLASPATGSGEWSFLSARRERAGIAVALQALQVARSSDACWYRSLGSFSSALLMTSSSLAGDSGVTRPTGIGVRFRIASWMCRVCSRRTLSAGRHLVENGAE